MQVGDLVRYKTNTNDIGNLGIIVGRNWSCPGNVWIVEWTNGTRCTYSEVHLEPA